MSYWFGCMFAIAGCGRLGFEQQYADAAGDVSPTDSLDSSDAVPLLVFGTMQVGSNMTNLGGNTVTVSQFAVPTSGTLVRLHLYLRSATVHYLRAVVFDESTPDTPGDLVASSGDSQLSGGPGWISVDLMQAAPVSAGNYWLGVHLDNQMQAAIESGPGKLASVNDTFSDGTQTPFASATYQPQQLSVYAEYSVP